MLCSAEQMCECTFSPMVIYCYPIEGLKVGVYLRRSTLAQEDSLGLQDEDTGDYAAERSATAVKVYPEDGKSAWKRKRVVLPSGAVGYRVIRLRFAELLADLRTGAVEGAVVYDLDRLTRDLRDLEDAIEVVEAYGRPIVGPGVGPDHRRRPGERAGGVGGGEQGVGGHLPRPQRSPGAGRTRNFRDLGRPTGTSGSRTATPAGATAPISYRCAMSHACARPPKTRCLRVRRRS